MVCERPGKNLRVAAVALVLLTSAASFADDPTEHHSPYAGEEARSVKSLSEEEVAGYLRGDGMGFAKLAELNSYPGPRHVLDAADKLDLSDEQLAETRALYQDMKRQVVALGEQLVAAESRLDQAFADGDIDAASLEAAVLEIGEIRARLRNVHLQAHLKQKELLTPMQVQHYDMIRGYGSHHSH